TLLAAFGPNATVAPLVKLVPVIVTLVPPAAGPDVGLTLLTVGAGGAPPMLYEPDVTGLGSEVVAADSVYDAAVEGLVMPLSTTLTLCPAGIVLLPVGPQVATWV